MDQVLARMFDLDRPLAERIEERNLQESFAKTASDLGLDLAAMPDGDVTTLYGQHLAMHFEKKAQLMKQAELVRIGRLLARQMFKQALDESPLPLEQATEQNFRGHVGGLAGTPEGRLRLLKQQRGYGGAGLHSDAITQLWEQELKMQNPDWSPEQVKTVAKEYAAPAIKEYEEKGRQIASQRALRQGEEVIQMTPEQLAKRYAVGEGLPPAAGGWSKWGPSGLLRALGEGDLATAGRKMLPIGGVALGLGYLMRKRNEDRERQLSASGMMGGGGAGMAPAVGI